jgi:hypothetical protein
VYAPADHAHARLVESFEPSKAERSGRADGDERLVHVLTGHLIYVVPPCVRSSGRKKEGSRCSTRGPYRTVARPRSSASDRGKREMLHKGWAVP